MSIVMERVDRSAAKQPVAALRKSCIPHRVSFKRALYDRSNSAAHSAKRRSICKDIWIEVLDDSIGSSLVDSTLSSFKENKVSSPEYADSRRLGGHESQDDACSTASSIDSCSAVHCDENRDVLSSDAESSSCARVGERRCKLSLKLRLKSDDKMFHRLELKSYRQALEKIHASGPLSWEHEEYLVDLRSMLHISNDEHLIETEPDNLVIHLSELELQDAEWVPVKQFWSTFV